MRLLLPRALAALATALAWTAQSAPLVKTEHVEAELVSDSAAAQPGHPVTVGLKLRMEPQWHTYWRNPGDSGLPTRIQWTLPPGWSAGEIQWPFPQPLPVGPLMNYGYEDEVVLLAPLQPPADAKSGPALVKAHADWLVCKDICIPESGDLEIRLDVASGPPAPNPRWQAHIERARAMLPVAAPGWKFESGIAGSKLVVRITPAVGATLPAKIFFFPDREGLIEPAAPEKLVKDGAALRIEMKLADPAPAGLKTVAGVAVAESGWRDLGGRKALEVSAPFVGTMAASAPSAAARVGADVDGSIAVALAFAFVGGVLLNLMPCVFPVLGIKVLGFVEHAHGEARAMRLQGVVFAAGTLLSFLVLAALMLAFRGAGAQLGWGFQLQSPAFVTLLAALFFVLALNLSGLFEWGAFAQSLTSNLSARGRYADAFLSGVLASVVATPCTAPFMGAAVGFTLSQNAFVSLAVFAVLGLGMALPVVMLSTLPGLLRKLPKPGAWMETFKQVLAFPLYATVAWLAWVLGAQAGNDAVLALLGGLVLVAMGAWMYGRWGRSQGSWRFALSALLAIAGIAVAWPGAVAPASGGEEPHARAGELPWQAWSPEKVRDLTASGQAVFVDFTAAWCVTCQVNKRVSLHNDAVVAAFAAHGVAALRADWTRQDPRITATLAALGRNAVPVYALYVPGEDAPRLLPEVLTPSLVLEQIAPLPAAKPGTGTALTRRGDLFESVVEERTGKQKEKP